MKAEKRHQISGRTIALIIFLTMLAFVYLLYVSIYASRIVNAKVLTEKEHRLYVKGENEPYTGKVLLYYPNGKKKEEADYWREDGTKVGSAWFEDGIRIE